MNNVQKLYSYLGLDGTCLNHEQVLCLIVLASQQGQFFNSCYKDCEQLMEEVVSYFLNLIEIGGLNVEQESSIYQLLSPTTIPF